MDSNPTKLYAATRFIPAGVTLDDGISVSIDELVEFIAQALSGPLAEHGFKFHRQKKKFVRKTKGGVDEILIRGIARVHFEFDFIFQKRIDEVQKIITRFNFENGFNSISDYRSHSTVSVCYSNITSAWIKAVTFPQMEEALKSLLDLMERQLLPGFEKLESLESLHDTLNYPERESNNPFSLFSLQKTDNAVIAGLLVAKFINHPHVAQLLERYRAETIQNEFMALKLLKVKEHLSKTT